MGAKKQHKSHADLGLTEVPMRVCVPLLENNLPRTTPQCPGVWLLRFCNGGFWRQRLWHIALEKL